MKANTSVGEKSAVCALRAPHEFRESPLIRIMNDILGVKLLAKPRTHGAEYHRV